MPQANDWRIKWNAVLLYWLVHLLAYVFFSHAFESGVEPQMLLHAQLVKKDIVLWTHAKVLTYALHLRADVMTIYGGRARCGRKQACQDGPITIQCRQSIEVALVSGNSSKICMLHASISWTSASFRQTGVTTNSLTEFWKHCTSVISVYKVGCHVFKEKFNGVRQLMNKTIGWSHHSWITLTVFFI